MEDLNDCEQVIDDLPKKRPRKKINVEADEGSDEDNLELPLSRIKVLVSFATDINIRSNSLKLIAKASELFLQESIKKTVQFTKLNNKKTIILPDLLQTISSNSNLSFIKDVGLLPENLN